MDAILSRVGDAELRQHCVAAVLDELLQADKQVKHVVIALERTLKVVQASRNVHKSLVLNESDQVQASFRQLGESCNQIGPLLRLLHHTMSATSITSAPQVAMGPTVGAHTQAKAAPTDSASTTTSEYELLSDDSEVVEVTPPKKKKKRKAAGDLSGPVRKKTLLDDTESVRKQLTKALCDIRATSTSSYTVAMHKDLSSFIKNVFSAAKFDNWQPRDDPIVAQLLNEMDKRMSVFKDSATQIGRRKICKEWQQKMSALSFVSSLDLSSLPPKVDPRATEVHKCHNGKDLRTLDKSIIHISSNVRSSILSTKKKREKYFMALVDASIQYFAAYCESKGVETRAGEVIQCMWSFHHVCDLVQSTTITRAECVHLEKALYLLRLVLAKNDEARKKAIKSNLVANILALFPPSARPNFSYPLEAKTKNKKKKKKHKK